MAQMATGSNITIMRIKEFLGLNENQDGDTKIRVGEMSEMRNFSITKDSHLQIRPGTHTLLHLRTAWDAWAEDQESPVEAPVFCGAWYGMVNNVKKSSVSLPFKKQTESSINGYSTDAPGQL